MDPQARLENLTRDSFTFDTDFTLDEMEWRRIHGSNGLGEKILQNMTALGAGRFQFGDIDRHTSSFGEQFTCALEGDPCQVRLEYDQPITASLLDAVRALLDGVNRSLRRADIPWRYLCARDACVGVGCTYRIMLVPTPLLDDAADEFNVVAGLQLEDYELQPPFESSDQDGGFLEAR